MGGDEGMEHDERFGSSFAGAAKGREDNYLR